MTGWVRSSHCAAGDCIEVRLDTFGDIAIRRLIDGRFHRSVIVTRAEWDAFVAGVKAGDFDDLGADPQ